MAVAVGLAALHPQRPLAVEGRGFLVLAVMQRLAQVARLETTEASLAAAARQRRRPIWAVVAEVAQAMQARQALLVARPLQAGAAAEAAAARQRHQPTMQAARAVKTELPYLMLPQAVPMLVLGHSMAVARPWVLRGLVALVAVPTQQPLTQAARVVSPAVALEVEVRLLRLALLLLAAQAALASSSCGAIDADLTG